MTKFVGFTPVSAKINSVIVNNSKIAGVWDILSGNGKNLVGRDSQEKPQSQGFIDEIHGQEACMASCRHIDGGFRHQGPVLQPNVVLHYPR